MARGRTTVFAVDRFEEMRKTMQDFRLGVIPALALGLTLFTITAAAQDKKTVEASAPRYRDASAAIDDRVADLLPRMTLEEKVHEIAGGWEGQVEVIDPTVTFTNEQARIALGKLQSPDFPFTAKQAVVLISAGPQP